MGVEMESMWILPARKLEQAVAPDDWGTKIAQFRGDCFDLFCVTVTDMAMWPEEYPLAAKCVMKSNGKGANRMEILDLLDRETVAREAVVAMPNGGLGSNGKPKPKRAK
jgi:hypothetical protein